MTVRDRGKRWALSDKNVSKVCIDVAFHDYDKGEVWGFIVRDSIGEGQMAGASRMYTTHSAFVAEAIACLQAMKCCLEQGMMMIQVETDCSNMVRAVRSSYFDYSMMGTIIQEIKNLVLFDFNYVQFVFVPRSCNRCAHELTACGFRRDPDQAEVLLDPLPESLQLCVSRDLAVNVE